MKYSGKNSAKYCHKCTYIFTQSTCYSCQICVKLEFFSTDFQKNTPLSGFMKIRLLGAKLFHVERRTDMSKLIVTFYNCVNTPKKLNT